MNPKGRKGKLNKKKIEDAVEDQPVYIDDYPTKGGKGMMLDSIESDTFNKIKKPSGRNGPHKRNVTTKG